MRSEACYGLFLSTFRLESKNFGCIVHFLHQRLKIPSSCCLCHISLHKQTHSQLNHILVSFDRLTGKKKHIMKKKNRTQIGGINRFRVISFGDQANIKHKKYFPIDEDTCTRV